MANAIAPGRQQDWEDRLREGAYTSPGGTRIKYDFEDVSRAFDKRTTAFGFGRVNGEYVQQNGFGSRRYPMRCYFSGRDHDRVALAFELALLEHGVGVLEHPIYGTVDVVPFGTVTRRDDLKTAANQTVIELEFYTTLKTLFPRGRAHPQTEILRHLGDFNVVAAQQFADSTDLKTTVDKANLKESVKKSLQQISDTLAGISSGVASVRQTFQDAVDIINFGIDVFIGQPLLLAQQVSDLIQAPARAAEGIESRLDAYDAFADRIFESEGGHPELALDQGSAIQVRRSKIANDFRYADHLALNSMAASVIAVIAEPVGDPNSSAQAALQKRLRKQGKAGAAFATKPQAMAAVARIVEKFDALVEWRDAGFDALESIADVHAYKLDTGDAYQALHAAVGTTVGFLIETSFSLVPERRIVLDRARTPIDLAAELYQSVDDETLDLLISTNDLVGEELFEVPRLRSIVYYP